MDNINITEKSIDNARKFDVRILINGKYKGDDKLENFALQEGFSVTIEDGYDVDMNEDKNRDDVAKTFLMTKISEFISETYDKYMKEGGISKYE